MMKHLIYSVVGILLCPFYSYTQTTYYSQGSGTWSAISWNSAPDGSGTPVDAASGNRAWSFIIQEGHTITLATRTPVYNITVEEGGKLFRDNASYTYLAVYGPEITINGQLGNGEIRDGISLDINGPACEIKGTGLIDLSRLKKDEVSNEPVTELLISRDINLRYGHSQKNSRTALLNTDGNTAFNVTIAEEATVSVLGYGDYKGSVSIDGPDGTNGNFSLERQFGTFTINGTLEISGDLFLVTDNEDVGGTPDIDEGFIEYVVNGVLKVEGEIIGNEGVSGTGVGALTLNPGSKLELTGGESFIDIHASRNQFTLQPGAIIAYNSSADQVISANLPYQGLSVSGGGRKFLNGDISIQSELNLESGIVFTQGYDLTIENSDSAAVKGGSVDSYVNGVLRRKMVGANAYLFPVGDTTQGNGYNPFTLNSKESSLDAYISASFTPFSEAIDFARSCETEEGYRALSYTCSAGKWDIDSDPFNYEISLSPSENTMNACGLATLFPSIRKTGDGEDILGCNEGITGVSFSSFSSFSIALASEAIVAPVELLGFEVEVLRGEVHASWVTATESNNAYFDLERSEDGQNFSKIARIEGAGTTVELTEYGYVDSAPIHGRTYYRLKQVDFDGQYEYFPIREIWFEGGSGIQVLAAYPNPTQDEYHMELHLTKPDQAYIEVLNMQGATVFMGELAPTRQGYNAISLPVERWEAGIYVYTVYAGSEAFHGKLVKQ